MLTTAALIDRWRRTREGTVALVQSIPLEHFDWRPHPDAFSCGDIVRHLMQAEQVFGLLLAAAGRGEAWDPWQMTGSGEERLRSARRAILDGAGTVELGTTPAACLEHWHTLRGETEAALATVPDAALTNAVEHPVTAIRSPLWEMFLLMIEHEIHHRGQLSAYLKVLGVDQPALLMR
jgi:uncharacterized damage-inducible protein DinB